MPNIICNKVAAFYHNTQENIGYPPSMTSGIRYGFNRFAIYNIDEYICYVMFDASQTFYHNVNKITLVRQRSGLYASDDFDPTIKGIEVDIQAFISTNPTASIIKPSETKLLGSAIMLPIDKATSGTISNDISINLSESAGGRIGLRFSRSSSNIGYAIDSDMYLNVEVDYIPALAPTNLLPQSTQNPRGTIVFSWWHSPNPNLSLSDPQVGSELTVWQDGVTPIVVTQNDASNTYTLAANTFTQYKTVYIKVRTRTQYNEWGQYAQSQFNLGTTPPLKSALIFPLNVSVNGTNGVPLEWSYNSPYDTFPTRFDVRYRIDDGAWITKTNHSSGSNPAYQSIMTNPITIQSKAEWQVMAYGALGDTGPWSDVGTFFTIGVPNAPTIIRVSNSNRPTVYFSATNLMAWELEIRKDDIKIYETGAQAFEGAFNHTANQFLDNGNYITRMRITNEYGLMSDWSTLPFAINTVTPAPLNLQIVRNLDFYVRLRFNNMGKTVYVYRSEFRKNKYLRIGVTKDSVYDDYTARPRQRYEYFVRVTSSDFSFADSNIETMALMYPHTTIAECDNPKNMLKLWKQLDSKPQKDTSFSFEKTLTRFVGRESPVLQIGAHSDKSLSLSFYCSISDYERLEDLARSHKALLLRDWRLGAIYGTIDGSISSAREMRGCIVSFVFTQVDFNEEVELI